MPNANEIQRLLADAWAAGYAARETELVCRRRSNEAQRRAQMDHFVQRVLNVYTQRVAEPTRQEAIAIS